MCLVFPFVAVCHFLSFGIVFCVASDWLMAGMMMLLAPHCHHVVQNKRIERYVSKLVERYLSKLFEHPDFRNKMIEIILLISDDPVLKWSFEQDLACSLS